MFSTLRTRFGIPGVISVIALVFAMFGGAYAASNSSGGGKATASAKAKKGPRGPKGATGPAGPAGAQGPAGPAGAKGDAGANGANGAAGPTGPTGAAGAKGTTGAAGATGATGFSGFTETLPAGKTETGTWGVSGAAGLARAPLSFSIPLAAAPEAADVHYLAVGGGGTTECPGTVAEPKAAAGQVCIYTEEATETSYFPLGGFPRRYPSGLVLGFNIETAGNAAAGTWAVTAE